jgi:hypothetical protein
VPDEDSDKAFLDDCQEFFAVCKLLESGADASNSVKFLLAFDEKKRVDRGLCSIVAHRTYPKTRETAAKAKRANGLRIGP